MEQWQNKLYYGDNLEVLRKYIEKDTIDLCYIDPPFNSKRNYNQIYNNLGEEDKAQAQAFVDTWTWDDMAEEGFAEIISNHNGVFTRQSMELMQGFLKVLRKGGLLSYLISMTLRIAEIFRVLKPIGSFYLHCDPTASHYLKLIIDSIFCGRGGDFRNEIIWWYETGGIPRYDFSRKHDVIFRYSKSEDVIFNAKDVMEPRSDEVLRRIATGIESATRSKGQFRHPSDVFKIASINAMARERLGYPTQKPETLLERIIKASSNEGDIVLDAYCGCGTTIAVAERLRRRWIGMDITYQSISLILKRLSEHFGSSILENIELNGIPRDMKSAIALAHKKDDRTRKEFEKWSILTFSDNRAIINEKKGGDQGIDGISFVKDNDEKDQPITKDVLFSVKSGETLSPSVIRDLNGTIEREQAAMGYLITLYSMDNLVKESKKYGQYENRQFAQTYPKIEVVSVQEILDGRRMEIPISLEVLKKAEQKGISSQIFLGLK
ncbi:MAG TPA: site-specific DNA-methyltransferase [archaeon]|nr:site-specific DNA-methyltransferase [archaeon]